MALLIRCPRRCKSAKDTFFMTYIGGSEYMNRDSLVNSFKSEVTKSDQLTFPICVDSFTNLWQYEFGSLDNLPSEIDDIIAYRAVELGLMDME